MWTDRFSPQPRLPMLLTWDPIQPKLGKRRAMRPVFLMIGQTRSGWSVFATNGTVLATFTGWAARWRAERYLTRFVSA